MPESIPEPPVSEPPHISHTAREIIWGLHLQGSQVDNPAEWHRLRGGIGQSVSGRERWIKALCQLEDFGYATVAWRTPSRFDPVRIRLTSAARVYFPEGHTCHEHCWRTPPEPPTTTTAPPSV